MTAESTDDRPARPPSFVFGPRSINTGCPRRNPRAANTEGLTHDIGHLPLSTSNNSCPTRRRRAGSNREVAEATCAVRGAFSIFQKGIVAAGRPLFEYVETGAGDHALVERLAPQLASDLFPLVTEVEADQLDQRQR